MVTVEFLGPIGVAPRCVDVASVKELSSLLRNDPVLEKWLTGCAVALNGTIISSLETPLKDGDHIALLPPVCGG